MDKNGYLAFIAGILFFLYLLIASYIEKIQNSEMAKVGLQQCVVHVKGNNSNYVVWQRECKDG